MIRTGSAALFYVALLCLSAGAAVAAVKVTVTKADAFASANFKKVAVVTAECQPVVDCSRLQQRVIKELGGHGSITFVPDHKVRKALLELGETEYNKGLRSALVEKLGLTGLFEIVVPHAERADGFGKKEGSQVKLELTILGPNGELLAHGVGTGRPHNVVTGPERVAGNIVEQIGKRLFR